MAGHWTKRPKGTIDDRRQAHRGFKWPLLLLTAATIEHYKDDDDDNQQQQQSFSEGPNSASNSLTVWLHSFWLATFNANKLAPGRLLAQVGGWWWCWWR